MRVFACILCISVLHGQEDAWVHNYFHAVELSQKSERALLVAVVNMQGCPWSKKFMEDVLLCPGFTEMVGEHFVLALVETKDLPIHVDETPCVFIQDPSETQMSFSGYLPVDYVAYGKMLIESAYIFQRSKNISLDTLEEDDLESLYKEAHAHGCRSLSTHILDVAMQRGRMLFAVLESYRYLVDSGKRKKEEALRLKDELQKRDPSNFRGMWFHIAFLDFCDRERKGRDPKRALEPLDRYIHTFGKKDEKYVWRAEMAIAEYLFTHGKSQKACKHARRAYETAPISHKELVARTLEVIERGL